MTSESYDLPVPALSPEQRARLHRSQTEALYAGLGKFVAAFEMIVFNMRQRLMFMLTKTGLDQQLVSPAFAELTAGPLLSVFRATVSTAISKSAVYADDEKVAGQAILDNIYNRILTMTQRRNEIVHGTWFIGWASADQNDFGEADGFKPKNTKSGVKITNISRTRADFDLLVDQCNQLSDLVGRLGLIDMGLSFTENFTWIEGKVTLEEDQWYHARKNV